MSRCQTCGLPFTPAARHHRFCSVCFRRHLADPDQHHDTGLRTVKALVTEGTFRELERAQNLIRAYLGAGGTAYPSVDAIYQAMTVTVLQAPELRPHDRHLEDVLAGVVYCHYPVPDVCGRWDQIDGHHLQPRSKGGTDGPLVYLCREHHDAVHARRDGIGWRELAAALGYAEIAAAWAAGWEDA
jgi:hypothetical protein